LILASNTIWAQGIGTGVISIDCEKLMLDNETQKKRFLNDLAKLDETKKFKTFNEAIYFFYIDMEAVKKDLEIQILMKEKIEAESTLIDQPKHACDCDLKIFEKVSLDVVRNFREQLENIEKRNNYMKIMCSGKDSSEKIEILRTSEEDRLHGVIQKYIRYEKLRSE